MFRSKIRIHTCRIILLTSLVWLLVDVALLAMYSECFGEGCGKKSTSEKILHVSPVNLITDLLIDLDPFRLNLTVRKNLKTPKI